VNKLILLAALCVVVGFVAAADPARPKISPIFHADVSVSYRLGTKGYNGGGLYAYDTKTNRARTDYKLEDEGAREHYIFIHILDRYDLHEEYTIEDQKCSMKPVTGQLQDPWEWVAKASYVSTGVFRGQKFDEWQYVQGNDTTRLAVLSSDTTTPVWQNTHSNYNGAITQLDLIFEEWDTKEPEDWVFYVPQICNYTSEGLVGGDVNAVIYFANNNWNCVNVACTSRVPAGTGQPGYQCAEFTARSLAAGGYLPGLSSTAAQSAYGNYKGNNLLVTTSLSKALIGEGFHTAGSVAAASALFGDGGEGAWSHACVGVGANTVDCHNNAREGNTASGIMYKGINQILAP